jgi:hypothetical protein
MISVEELVELVGAYTRSAQRYNFATADQIDGFVEAGHKCYGRTSGRQVFVVHRSVMTGAMAYSVSDSLAEILFLLAMAGDQAGVPLAHILDAEDSSGRN